MFPVRSEDPEHASSDPGSRPSTGGGTLPSDVSSPNLVEDSNGRRSLDLVESPEAPGGGERSCMTARGRGASGGKRGHPGGRVSKCEGKPARVRTVMTEKQLLTLK